eukprot:1157293-Pleurochrysis_carterae.AAC.1
MPADGDVSHQLKVVLSVLRTTMPLASTATESKKTAPSIESKPAEASERSGVNAGASKGLAAA